MNLPVLVGSQALLCYKRLKGRTPDDWDFIVENPESYNHPLLDLMDANNSCEPTNKIIFELSQKGDIIDSPIGPARLIPLSLLKVLKISSIPINKIKHETDLLLLEDVILNQDELNLTKERTLETKNKVVIQKNNFFNKYRIERFFIHDDLHFFISKQPMFLKIQKENSTIVWEDMFLNLSFEDKKLLLWEEAFVLSLERYLVPNVRKYPNLIDNFVDFFWKVNKSSDPGLYWLNQLCEEGKLKDNPNFIQNWGKSNYDRLIEGYSQWWEKTFDQIDEPFWEKLLTFK